MATTDVNNPGTTDIAGEVWPDGDLPSQGFGASSTLMPGIYEFTLPMTLPQQWDTIDAKDPNPRSKTVGQTVTRDRLKFTKDAPLVVASGPHQGDTLTASFSTQQRDRSFGKDPQGVFVSDLAYFLEIGLNDKSRPTTAQALKAKINSYAGKTIRIETGLSAHCRGDKVRYVPANPADPNDTSVVQDPSGTKGCGDDSKKRDDGKGKKGRYYTKDFKDPETGNYEVEIQCDCGAVLRGFPSVERFVPPLGVGK